MSSSSSSREARLERLLQPGDELGVRPLAAIRVNPDFAVQGSGMRMGGGPQQFGVDAEQVPALLAELATAEMTTWPGFHVFAGSQNLRADILAEAQERTVDLVLELAAHATDAGRAMSTSAAGSASPTSRRTSRSTSTRLGDNLGGLLATASRHALPQARIVVELGRYLVGECGVYVTRVVDTKVPRGSGSPSSTGVSITSSPPRATSARPSGATTLWSSARGSTEAAGT